MRTFIYLFCVIFPQECSNFGLNNYRIQLGSVCKPEYLFPPLDHKIIQFIRYFLLCNWKELVELQLLPCLAIKSASITGMSLSLNLTIEHVKKKLKRKFKYKISQWKIVHLHFCHSTFSSCNTSRDGYNKHIWMAFRLLLVTQFEKTNVEFYLIIWLVGWLCG